MKKLSILILTLQYWRSNNYTNTGAGSIRPRQVLAHISVTIIINLLLLSILTKTWSRNRLVTFLISTTIFFPRWRPIWPPNHNNSHISAHKHDRKTNLVSIAMYSWTRNPLLTFSILATICFPRWRPIWPPNHNNSHISAHKHERETNLVSITIFSWTRNPFLALLILTILYFQDGGQYGRQIITTAISQLRNMIEKQI